MSDLARLLPEDFVRGLRAAGITVPPDFAEAYELLCEVVYYGTGIASDSGRVAVKGHERDYFFGEPRLLGFKDRVDRALAETGSSLRRWSAARARAGARQPRPEPDRRSDLAGTGVARDHSSEREEEA